MLIGYMNPCCAKRLISRLRENDFLAVGYTIFNAYNISSLLRRSKKELIVCFDCVGLMRSLFWYKFENSLYKMLCKKFSYIEDM